MPVKEYLEAGDTSLIEDAAQCLRDKVLIRLLRRLGCRIGEVLGMEERHIDFSQRQVKIEHEKMRVSLFCPYCPQEGDKKTRLSKKAIFCPKCGKVVEQAIAKAKQERHLRKVPIDPDTLKLVREYIKKGGITEVHGKRMLFTISRQWAWHIVVKCAERAGIFELENPINERKHHVSPHKFRDAFAINAIKIKPTADDLRLLQELLGHESYDTTMRYRKVSGAELQHFYDDLMKEEK
jgi:integrase/recombinase XerD